jgi:nucleoside-diphosphate-sugar epimerase
MATEGAGAAGGYVVLREAEAGHWVVVGDVDRRPGLSARNSRIQAVRDAIGREPADHEVYAALPRSEWRVARHL